MDDIYFSDKGKKNKSEDDSASIKEFTLPPINDPRGDSGAKSDGFEDISSFYGEGKKYDIPSFPATSNAPVTPDNYNSSPVNTPVLSGSSPDVYAPYMGKAKKIKNQPAPAEEAPHETIIKNARSHRRGKAKFIAIVLIIALLAPVIAVFSVITSADYTKGKLKRNDYIESSALASSSKIKNILFLGVDGKTGEDNLRSDSMILLSVDSEHKKIKLSSFMRDSWVEIPDYKEAKLNAACSHGGPQLVSDTIEYNFKVDIEDYVLVNFDMFTEMIDAIGGVDVEVTEKEAKFINRTTRHTIESGESVHLNGAQALVYARIRKLDSDYMRTFRQRKIIKALIVQAKKAGPFKLWKILNEVLPKLETSLSSFELTALAFKGAFALLFYDTASTRIPTDSLSRGGYKGSQSVVLLDIPENAQFLYDFIYNDVTDAKGVDEN